MRFSGRVLALALALVMVLGGPCAVAASAAEAGGEPAYTLREETVIRKDAPPLTDIPRGEECCALHFLLTLGVMGLAAYYTYDRKKRQAREFELRAELR